MSEKWKGERCTKRKESCGNRDWRRPTRKVELWNKVWRSIAGSGLRAPAVITLRAKAERPEALR